VVDRLVLVVPPGHRWNGVQISPMDLVGEPLLLREPGSGSRIAAIQNLEGSGVAMTDLNVALELGSNAAIKDAVGRGLGVAFLSWFSVQKELDSGELRIVEVEGLDPERDFYIAYDRRRPLPPAAMAFLHHLEDNPIRPAAR
jgi:LysR family transcriptional regulator, low CO2-responsive transcriptional regulator